MRFIIIFMILTLKGEELGGRISLHFIVEAFLVIAKPSLENYRRGIHAKFE